MSTSATSSASTAPAPSPLASAPWFVWLAALAVGAIAVGIQWDIAWHRSIGRDSFWSPPHIAIYLGGIVGALTSAALIFATTFSRSAAAREASRASVGVWGFRGPLGAFITAWGGGAMLASAPFDDWWHNAYGLDVKILSPPHTVLATGIFMVLAGALLLIGGWRNRADGIAGRAASVLFLVVGGLLLSAVMTFEMEFTWRAAQHSGTFYRAVACGAPVVLIAVGRASGLRWGATWAAAVYMLFWLALLWVFPLVPAAPKLGPVYHPVTHLVPAGFPLLLVAPAFAVDAAAPRLAHRPPWQQALALGALFLGAFVAVQWPFSSFLMTPPTRNWFFGTHYFDYQQRPDFADIRNVFYDLDGGRAAFRFEMALALVASVLSTRIGLAIGEFVARVRR
jgi:hypothetical protein